jgi:hypothetical protein
MPNARRFHRRAARAAIGLCLTQRSSGPLRAANACIVETLVAQMRDIKRAEPRDLPELLKHDRPPGLIGKRTHGD